MYQTIILCDQLLLTSILKTNKLHYIWRFVELYSFKLIHWRSADKATNYLALESPVPWEIWWWKNLNKGFFFFKGRKILPTNPSCLFVFLIMLQLLLHYFKAHTNTQKLWTDRVVFCCWLWWCFRWWWWSVWYPLHVYPSLLFLLLEGVQGLKAKTALMFVCLFLHYKSKDAEIVLSYLPLNLSHWK